jgi:putative transposase
MEEFIVDETILKVGSEFTWLWVAIEPENRMILVQNITRERNMLVAEKFMSDLVKVHGNHPVSTDGGSTWYPMACRFLKLKHHIHSPLEKSLIERKMQYIKTEPNVLMITFLVIERKNYKLKYVWNWLNLFVNYHNTELKPVN